MARIRFNQRQASARVPSYRRHKPTDQAVVTINGRDIYLGKWNSKTSRAEYDRLVSEWLANGRRLPDSSNDLTVAELAHGYLNYAKSYYVKNGKPTGWLVHIKLVIRRLRESYGHTLAVDFGPLAFKAFRQRFVAEGHSRGYVNKLMAIVPRMFKWVRWQGLHTAPTRTCPCRTWRTGLCQRCSCHNARTPRSSAAVRNR